MRSQRRFSTRQVQTARMMVSSPIEFGNHAMASIRIDAAVPSAEFCKRNRNWLASRERISQRHCW